MMLTASLLKATLTLCVWFLMNLNGHREGGRLSKKQRWTLMAALCALQLLFCLGLDHFFGPSLLWLNLEYCLFMGPLSFLPFWNYRGRVYQNLFVLFTTAMFATVTQGLGNAVEIHLLTYYAPDFARMGNFLVSLALMAVVFPPLYVLLRRLYASWQGPQTRIMWRVFWLIPMAYLFLSLATANFTQPQKLLTLGFVLSRVEVGLTMFVLLYIVTAVLRQEAHTAEMAERARLIDQQLSLQRTQYDLLTRHIEESRAARHDLRHHVAVMQGYLDDDDLAGLVGFVDQALQALPEPQEARYCENWAVNALLRHTLALAAQADVDADVQVTLPNQPGRIRDTDLCVVIGNCLENALEAARKLPPERRRLFMRTALRGPYLAILIDNLFDGEVQQRQGDFLSSKHSGMGVGLASVQAVARQYDGVAAFWAYEGLFHSMILLRLDPPAAVMPPPYHEKVPKP